MTNTEIAIVSVIFAFMFALALHPIGDAVERKENAPQVCDRDFCADSEEQLNAIRCEQGDKYFCLEGV